VEGVRRTNVASVSPAAQFAVSRTGTLAYVPGPATLGTAALDVALLDFNDTIARVNLPPNEYEFPRFSPDGRYLAVGAASGTSANISIYELSGGSQLRRLTFGGRNRLPAWTPDGKHVAFQSDRGGDHAIYWQPADGTGIAQRLTKPEKGHIHWPYDWSPSGETMLYGIQHEGMYSLWTFSVKTGKSEPFGGVRSPSVIGAAFAPDGKWVAYSAIEGGGVTMVYVQPFPSTGAPYQIAGGINPFWSGAWSPDGGTLYYSPGPQPVFHAVAVRTRPTFTFSKSMSIPRTRALLRIGFPGNYDISPKGDRFAIIVDATASTDTGGHGIDVVLNWFEELKQRVPTSSRN
jgi:Tol biopolymer transport system component